MWVITATSPKDGVAGDGTLAVIANAEDFGEQLEELEGQVVVANGADSAGVSIRMAGPEIVLTSISAAPGD